MEQDIYFKYIFELSARKIELLFEIDPRTMTAKFDSTTEKPAWTKLSFCKCSICPLEEARVSHCPLAVATLKPILQFKDNVSYETVNVRVETRERTYSKSCDLQKGMSSLLGLLMATSGCPFFNALKPMARFHLPFSSLEDTIYRVVSSFLLREYFLNKRKPDLTLKGLITMYQNLQVVNEEFLERLRTASDKDSSANAVIILDAFAKLLPMSIESGLNDLGYLFKGN